MPAKVVLCTRDMLGTVDDINAKTSTVDNGVHHPRVNSFQPLIFSTKNDVGMTKNPTSGLVHDNLSRSCTPRHSPSASKHSSDTIKTAQIHPTGPEGEEPEHD